MMPCQHLPFPQPSPDFGLSVKPKVSRFDVLNPWFETIWLRQWQIKGHTHWQNTPQQRATLPHRFCNRHIIWLDPTLMRSVRMYAFAWLVRPSPLGLLWPALEVKYGCWHRCSPSYVQTATWVYENGAAIGRRPHSLIRNSSPLPVLLR